MAGSLVTHHGTGKKKKSLSLCKVKFLYRASQQLLTFNYIVPAPPLRGALLQQTWTSCAAGTALAPTARAGGDPGCSSVCLGLLGNLYFQGEAIRAFAGPGGPAVKSPWFHLWLPLPFFFLYFYSHPMAVRQQVGSQDWDLLVERHPRALGPRPSLAFLPAAAAGATVSPPGFCTPSTAAERTTARAAPTASGLLWREQRC